MTVTWILVGVIVVLVLLVGWFALRELRVRRLRREFGPEYDRVLAVRGDRRTAERELRERRDRVNAFEITDLDAPSQQRFASQWQACQRRFVDEPAVAVGEAHALVQEVMRERGYPVESDFEQRAADISVEHGAVVENYRAANDISARASSGQATTEQLRQAMVHFRALFDDLLGPGDPRAQTADEFHGDPTGPAEANEGARA